MDSVKAKDAQIRFAVGTPDGERSNVWRLWTRARRNDAYLAVRNLAGEFKVSFHGEKEGRPAQWRVALVDLAAGDDQAHRGKVLSRSCRT